MKKILAVAIATLAVAGILLVAGAIVGTWIINDKVTDLTLTLLGRVDMGIDQSDLLIEQVDEDLGRIDSRVEAVETAAFTLGGVLEENRIVLNLMSELLGAELGARVQRAGQTVESIRAAAESIDSTVQTLDALPFVNLQENRPRLALFGSIADGLGELQTEVADTRNAVDERRTEIIEGGVSIVTERTSRLSGRIDNVQRLLGELDAQLASLKARIQETKQTFSRTLDLLTLLLNLLLLLVALAFLSLFAHSVSLFKRPEQSFSELVGWSGPANEEIAVESPRDDGQEAE